MPLQAQTLRDTQVDTAKARSEQLKNETEAKVLALQKKVVAASAERKAAINKQIVDLRKQYSQTVAEFRTDTAAELREAADRLEKAG